MIPQEVKLVILDDDRAFGARLAKSFISRNYDCLHVISIAEMESKVSDFVPTHAVVDLCLGRESGLDAVTQLVSRFQTKVVVLTGYSSVPTALEAVRRGALNYLSKPVVLEELLSALFGPALTPVGALPSDSRALSLNQVEWEHIQRVLLDCGGNITHAARRLGMHRQALQRKLKSPPIS